jgi:hypothetical protein
MTIQLLRKVFVSLLLVCSATLTGGLAYVYFGVLLGWVSGAGAAQWQIAFAWWPLSAIFALPPLVLSIYPRPSLPSKYTVVSIIAIVLPVIMATLVLYNPYG